MTTGLANNQEGELDDEDAHVQDEPLRTKKRLRLRGPEFQSSHPQTSSGPSTAAFPLKMPKLEDDAVPENSSRLQPQSAAALCDGNGIVDKGKQPVSPQVTPRGRRFTSDRAPPAVPFKEPTVEPGATLSPKNKTAHPHALIKPKDEPIDDMPDYEVPISVIPRGIQLTVT